MPHSVDVVQDSPKDRSVLDGSGLGFGFGPGSGMVGDGVLDEDAPEGEGTMFGSGEGPAAPWFDEGDEGSGDGNEPGCGVEGEGEVGVKA